jgi:hypothetical protein
MYPDGNGPAFVIAVHPLQQDLIYPDKGITSTMTQLAERRNGGGSFFWKTIGTKEPPPLAFPSTGPVPRPLLAMRRSLAGPAPRAALLFPEIA